MPRKEIFLRSHNAALAIPRLRRGLVRVTGGWSETAIGDDIVHRITMAALIRAGVAEITPDGRKAILSSPSKGEM